MDAFGVGEPDIALSGTTIEIQIPGLSDSTVEERAADLECIADAEGRDLRMLGRRADRRPPRWRGSTSHRRWPRCVSWRATPSSPASRPRRPPTPPRPGSPTEPKAAPSASASATPSFDPVFRCGKPDADGGPGLDGGRVLPDGLRRRGAAVLSGLRDRAGRLQVARHEGDRNARGASRRRSQRPRTPRATPTPAPAKEVRVALGLRVAEPPRPIRWPPTRSSIRPARRRCRATSRRSRRPQQGLDAIAVEHMTTRYCVVSSQGQDLGLLHDPECGRRAAARDRSAAPVGADRPDRSARGAAHDRDRDAERPSVPIDAIDVSDRRRARLEGVPG